LWTEAFDRIQQAGGFVSIITRNPQMQMHPTLNTMLIEPLMQQSLVAEPVASENSWAMLFVSKYHNMHCCHKVKLKLLIVEHGSANGCRRIWELVMLKVLVKSSVQKEAGATRMNREYLSASLKG
jgi:hypothetical protein